MALELMSGIRDLPTLLRSMSPKHNAGAYVFASVAALPPQAIASMREAEGLSVVLPEAVANALGIESGMRCAWITLTVNSALEAVGLTAAVASALAAAGIACNVIAAIHHDHLFVPFEEADRALRILQDLSTASNSPDA